MQKETKKHIAAMFSLMERMEHHYTGLEANVHKEIFNEAVSVASQKGVLYPKSKLTVAVDHGSKKKEVQILITSVASEDINKVRSKYAFTSAVSAMDNTTTGMGRIEMTKEIPYYEVKKRVKKDGADEKTKPEKNIASDSGEFNLDDELENLFEAEDFNLDDEFGALFGDNEDDNSVSQKTDSSETEEGGTNGEVRRWLNDTYKPIVDIITDNGRNPRYDKDCIDELYDVDNLFAQYMSKRFSPEELTIMSDKSNSEIIDDINKALKTGDFSSFSNSITPLDIDSVIWGNQLSSRNVGLINKQAAVYGFNPTMLYGPTIWRKYFNRTLKDNARPFVISGNMVGRHGKANTGTKGHVEGFNTGVNTALMVAYDISDTTLIDPSKGDPYTDLPGLASNITGQKNEAALKYIENIKSRIPKELLEKAESTSSDTGKARIYNTALIEYAAQKGLQADMRPINDTDADGTVMAVYLHNISSLATAIIKLYNFANKENEKRFVDMLSFCIAYYTTGVNAMSRSGMIGTNLAVTWKDEANTLVMDISNIFQFIRSYVKSAFAPLREKINELLSAESKINDVPDETEANPVQSNQQPVKNTVQSNAMKAIEQQKQDNPDGEALNEEYSVDYIIKELLG